MFGPTVHSRPRLLHEIEDFRKLHCCLLVEAERVQQQTYLLSFRDSNVHNFTFHMHSTA
jgi:hypothetical protein